MPSTVPGRGSLPPPPTTTRVLDAPPDDAQITAIARRSAPILLRASLTRVVQLQTLQENIAAGEKAYREQRFRAAQDAYRAVLIESARVEASLPAVITALLQDGDAALAEGNSAPAAAAFGQVLAIRPAQCAQLDTQLNSLATDALALVEQGQSEVSSDGVGALGRLTQHPLALRPGQHRVLASAPGYKHFDASIGLDDTPSQTPEITLARLPGDLRIALTPAVTAAVLIDNAALGNALGGTTSRPGCVRSRFARRAIAPTSHSSTWTKPPSRHHAQAWAAQNIFRSRWPMRAAIAVITPTSLITICLGPWSKLSLHSAVPERLPLRCYSWQ